LGLVRRNSAPSPPQAPPAVPAGAKALPKGSECHQAWRMDALLAATVQSFFEGSRRLFPLGSGRIAARADFSRRRGSPGNFDAVTHWPQPSDQVPYPGWLESPLRRGIRAGFWGL